MIMPVIPRFVPLAFVLSFPFAFEFLAMLSIPFRLFLCRSFRFHFFSELCGCLS